MVRRVVAFPALVYTSHMEELEAKSGRLVHEFLAHSYLIYLAAVVVGFGMDLIWPVTFSAPYLQPLGFGFIVLGTVLSVWAQASSEKGGHIRYAKKEAEELRHDHFSFGPYRFSRTPTQYGLFLMTLGLALLFGAFFMVCTTLIAFLLGKFVFIKKEERHLAKKYGAPYLEYKKKVRF